MGKISRSDVDIELKNIPFEVMAIDTEGRTVEAHAAIFGNVDEVNDIIHPGAFAKTITERGNKIKYLWQHQSDEPIGKLLELREDEQGLFYKAVISDTRRGRDVLALLKDGAIFENSIGFDVMDGGLDYTDLKDGDTVRNLRELRLWEISLVTFPANEQAQVMAVKERAFETKADKLREIKRLLDEVIDEETKSPPWHIEQRDDKWCVLKSETDEVEKCHDTEEAAQAHLRALYASEKSASEASEPEAGPVEPPTSDVDEEALRLAMEIELLEV